MRRVFVTGGTGYIGKRLIPALMDQGHRVVALIRPGSGHKLPLGCTAVFGDAQDGTTYVEQVRPGDTFVQLVGVAHPAPGVMGRMMEAYIAARSVCEDELQVSGLNATILRPWYLLGPGHRWPYVLIPFLLAGRTHPIQTGQRPATGIGDIGTDGEGAG